MNFLSRIHGFRRSIPGLLAIIASTPLALAAPDFELPETLEDTLSFYCYDCHGGGIQEGGLDLEETPFDLSNPHYIEKWAHVFDRVEKGEMPPKEEEQPDSDEKKAFLEELYPALLNADRADSQTKGRVRSRRLTRAEYENSIHDLLGIRIPLANLLPNDESKEEFQTIAKTQQLSHFHLNQYLQTADAALHEAMGRSERGGKRFFQKYNADRLTAFVNSSPFNYRGPQKKNGRVYSWNRSIAFNGSMRATRVPQRGWYRITVKNARAINPDQDGIVWGTLKTGAGIASQAQLYLAEVIEATAKPKDIICEAWMEEGHLVVITPGDGEEKRLFRRGKNKDREARRVYFHGHDLEEEGFPAIAFDDIRIKRIYPGGNQKKLRETLFPGIEFKSNKPLLPNPEADIKRLVASFANKAFRRPTGASHLRPYQLLALQRYEETEDLFQAIHEGYRAILCSPRFLTLVEPAGPLDEHAIASRLSYLLWSSVPDQGLLNLADTGQLGNTHKFQQEIERLLTNPRSQRFVTDFTDQWLQLGEIDFTSPDPRRFRSFDSVLQESMLRETRGFFRELLDKNIPVHHFIDSDFAMLNKRLQRHYKLGHLEVKSGQGIQRVKVKPKDRSGLVTQASILKVTADGSVTSPVLRGVWIGERILGLHIPPPPANIPAIEPDIRGAISIRDQLEKHRADPSCAACHTKIDPQGFALESFDPTGALRSHYGKTGKSAEVDPSGITPDGTAFQDIEEWKAIYSKRHRMIAKAFLEQFLAYATGAEIRFSDRPAIEAILNESKDDHYRLRSLIIAALKSEIFLTK